MLQVVVTTANETDRRIASKMLAPLCDKFPSIKKLWADGGYAGKLVDFACDAFGLDLEIVKKERATNKFKVLQWRWIVERTFAWLNRSRRLSKDYEVKEKTGEAWIKVAMINLMLNRLEKC
jgi:transposase